MLLGRTPVRFLGFRRLFKQTFAKACREVVDSRMVMKPQVVNLVGCCLHAFASKLGKTSVQTRNKLQKDQYPAKFWLQVMFCSRHLGCLEPGLERFRISGLSGLTIPRNEQGT